MLLVTASHVAETQMQGGRETLCIPMADGEATSIGGLLTRAIDDDRYDVAVARLALPMIDRLIESGRSFLDVLDLGDVDPRNPPPNMVVDCGSDGYAGTSREQVIEEFAALIGPDESISTLVVSHGDAAYDG